MGFGCLEAPMIRLLVAMLLLAGLGACAPPPSYTSMVPELATAELGPGPAPSYRGAITVAPVSIGTDTSVPWTSQIGSRRIPGSAGADADARQPGEPRRTAAFASTPSC